MEKKLYCEVYKRYLKEDEPYSVFGKYIISEDAIEEFGINTKEKIKEYLPDYNEEELNILKQQAEKELQEIKEWFISTDWIPNKVITGEWEETDKRWITYLADRKVYRHRQDEINELLGE